MKKRKRTPVLSAKIKKEGGVKEAVRLIESDEE